MKKIDKVWLAISSELLVNLAAGWFGAVLIVPNFAIIKTPFNLLVLIVDMLAGIFCLGLAFKLRKFSLIRRGL